MTMQSRGALVAAGTAWLALGLMFATGARAEGGGLVLLESSFHFPEDGAPNRNGSIGPFCCTGQTAIVHDATGRAVGYAYYFGWTGQAYQDPFRVPEFEIQVSGPADLDGDPANQQTSALTFTADAVSTGSTASTQAGALYYRATLQDFVRTSGGGRQYFVADSLRVALEVSTVPLPSPLPPGQGASGTRRVPAGALTHVAPPPAAPASGATVVGPPPTLCGVRGRITGSYGLVHQVSIHGPDGFLLRVSPDPNGTFQASLPQGRFRVVLESGGKFGLRAVPASYQDLTCSTAGFVDMTFDVQGVEEG